jgi:hypothetical protein
MIVAEIFSDVLPTCMHIVQWAEVVIIDRYSVADFCLNGRLDLRGSIGVTDHLLIRQTIVIIAVLRVLVERVEVSVCPVERPVKKDRGKAGTGEDGLDRGIQERVRYRGILDHARYLRVDEVLLLAAE